MKKQESEKTTLAKSLKAQEVSRVTKHKGLVISADHRNESFEYWPRPSELELAELAARLARTKKIDPKQLVNEAWSIYWESCQKIKEDHVEVEKRLRVLEGHDAAGALDEYGGLPRPKGYPVTFQEMERLLLPKLRGRTADRATLFREYIFAEMVDRSCSLDGDENGTSYWDYRPEDLDEWREAVQDEVARVFGNWRSTTYDARAYANFGASFLRWHQTWMDVKKSEVKAANALKGWEKRRKAKTAKTGARPKAAVLRQILEKPLPGVDGSSGPKKA